MSTVSECAHALATAMNEDLSFVKQVARRLVDDGLLPKSSGRNFAHVDDGQLSLLMLAVQTTDGFAASSKSALAYGGLLFTGEAGELTLKDMLYRTFTACREKSRVVINPEVSVHFLNLQFEITTSYPRALIHDRPTFGEPVLDGALNFVMEGQKSRHWPNNFPHKSVLVPGQCFLAIINDLDAQQRVEKSIGKAST